jgi:hypothetical protein
MAYIRWDNPAPMPPVTCVVCGRTFTPQNGTLWRVQKQYAGPLNTYPWCCSNRCGGARGGAASTQARHIRHPRQRR